MSQHKKRFVKVIGKEQNKFKNLDNLCLVHGI